MDKEMKKLLLVAVSVGVFLLVTITVAIIVMTPRAQKNEAAMPIALIDKQTPKKTFINTLPASPAAEAPVESEEVETPANDVLFSPNGIKIINNNNNNNEVAIIDRNNGNSVTIQIPIPINSGNTSSQESNTNIASPNNQTQVQFVREQQAAVKTTETASAAPETAKQTPAAAQNTTAAAGAQPTASTPQTRNTPAAATSSTASVVQAASTRSASSSTSTRQVVSSPVRAITDYWIQIGAYSARVRAEDAKEFLDSKGIVSIIENRDINGQIWYRVRLGPYISENEAKHWLEIVQVIDGFSGSQIRQTVRTQ